MINKYALGTIVGAALLGLAKKNSGSQMRLKSRKDRYTEKRVFLSFHRHDESYDQIVPEVEDMVNQWLINNPHLKVQSISTYNQAYGDDVATDEWLYVVLKQREHEEFDEDDEDDDPWLYYDWNPVRQLAQLLAMNIDHDRYDVEEDGRYDVEENIVYNADTGELYKKPELHVPKLRIR